MKIETRNEGTFIILKRGDIVKLNGVPITLTADTEFKCNPGNERLLTHGKETISK